ncbi:hypothetical protein pb186bvf_007875 [Paramecium bursaria]
MHSIRKYIYQNQIEQNYYKQRGFQLSQSHKLIFMCKYFRIRRIRYKLYAILAVSLLFWLLIQGSSSMKDDYVFRDSKCVYPLTGSSKCYDYSEDCYINNIQNRCSKADSIKSLYVTGVLYPTIYLFIAFCYTIYYWLFHRDSNITGYLQCCYILWIVCSFICMILFFQSAKKQVDDFINSTSGFQVNVGIKGLSILFGILHMIHLIVQCFVSADFHNELTSYSRISNTQS